MGASAVKQKKQQVEEHEEKAVATVKPTKAEVAEAKDCLSTIEAAIKSMNVCWYDVCIGMMKAHEGNLAEKAGYESFRDYVEGKLEMKYRRAIYLVNCGIMIDKKGITRKQVEKIGWTKLSQIFTVWDKSTKALPPAKADKLTDSLLEDAETLSVSQLKDRIETKTSFTPAQKAKAAVFRLGLKLVATEAEIVSAALKVSEAILGIQNDNEKAIAHICGEWMEMKGENPEKLPLKDMLKYVESVYGVELTIAAKAESRKTTAATKSKKKAEPVKETPDDDSEEGVDPFKMGKDELIDLIDQQGLDVKYTPKTPLQKLRTLVAEAIEKEEAGESTDQEARSDDEQSAEDLLGL
jgi:hypothetical protein